MDAWPIKYFLIHLERRALVSDGVLNEKVKIVCWKTDKQLQENFKELYIVTFMFRKADKCITCLQIIFHAYVLLHVEFDIFCQHGQIDHLWLILLLDRRLDVWKH